MALRLPTISELQRATACVASVALEQITEAQQTAAAKRGSLIGAVIAAELRGWPKPDVGRYKIKVDMAQLRAYLGDGNFKCEAAMSLRPDGSVEDLGENIGRNYNRPGTICGAADIIVARKHALCVDVKTGTYPVPDPVDNWQVASLAAMLAKVLDGDVEDVTGVIAKLNRDGSWDFGTPHTWSLVELANVRARLCAKFKTWNDAQLLYEAGFAEPIRERGSHCFFCKANCEFGRIAQRQEAA